jgi:hypothetical protein
LNQSARGLLVDRPDYNSDTEANGAPILIQTVDQIEHSPHENYNNLLLIKDEDENSMDDADMPMILIVDDN